MGVAAVLKELLVLIQCLALSPLLEVVAVAQGWVVLVLLLAQMVVLAVVVALETPLAALGIRL